MASRDDDEFLELGELNVDANAVVCQGREGQGAARREGEVEGNGDVEVSGLSGVAHELAARVASTSQLCKSAARFARQFLPCEEEGAPERVDRLATDEELGLLDHEVANIINVVRVSVAEFWAYDIRAIRVLLRAARELLGGVIVDLAPLILGLLECGHLLLLREAVVIIREVLEELRLIVLGTGVARGAAVHEDGELLPRERGARVDTVPLVNCGDARKLDVKVKEVQEVSDPIDLYLTLLTKHGRGVEGLRETLHREARVTLPSGAPEGRLGVAGQSLVEHADRKNVIRRHVVWEGELILGK